jgi:hypothetical protein
MAMIVKYGNESLSDVTVWLYPMLKNIEQQWALAVVGHQVEQGTSLPLWAQID